MMGIMTVILSFADTVVSFAPLLQSSIAAPALATSMHTCRKQSRCFTVTHEQAAITIGHAVKKGYYCQPSQA
jgi:hypothetical protein